MPPMTKVFITWSGNRSQHIARGLHDFLPTVIQSLEPFVSTRIGKGSAWESTILSRLEESDIGIVCLTPENLHEPWIHFESGAMAKKILSNESRVCTYLYELKPSDVQFPLSMFQHTLADKDETRRLLLDIRSFINAALPEESLNKIFDKMWPDFDEVLKSTPTVAKVQKRPTDDILDELLTLTREIAKGVPRQSQPVTPGTSPQSNEAITTNTINLLKHLLGFPGRVDLEEQAKKGQEALERANKARYYRDLEPTDD
jgi:hypothetical protein